MHKKVRRFGIDGIIADDAMFTTNRTYYEKLILDDMREAGFIPVLGMGPYFSTEFNAEKKNYNFVVSAYGVFVGERKSWKYEGIDVDTGNLLPRYTHQSKSKRPSTPSE